MHMLSPAIQFLNFYQERLLYWKLSNVNNGIDRPMKYYTTIKWGLLKDILPQKVS